MKYYSFCIYIYIYVYIIFENKQNTNMKKNEYMYIYIYLCLFIYKCIYIQQSRQLPMTYFLSTMQVSMNIHLLAGIMSGAASQRH